MKKIEKKIELEKEICRKVGAIKYCSRCGANPKECEEYRRNNIRPFINDFLKSGKYIGEVVFMFRKKS